MKRTVIIAAMEREVKPLVRSWRETSISSGARRFRAFEKDELLVAISGIGREHAEAAARALVAQYRPAQLVSAGVAGALIPTLKVGSVFTPNVIVDAADGTEYRANVEVGTIIGGGILVSADEIASPEAKAALVERFHALVVDMEAASVAKVAQEAGIGFGCVKAISDEAGFIMPPLGQFVDADGNFQARKFAVWAAVRPWQWASVVKLGRNTSKAVRALCDWLEKNLAVRVSAEVVTLKRAELPDVVPGRR